MSDINATIYYGSAPTTASDTVVDPAGPFAGFVVTVTGTVSITMPDNSTIAFPSITAGPTPYRYAFKRLNVTGTTATVVGLYAPPIKPPINPGAGVVQP